MDEPVRRRRRVRHPSPAEPPARTDGSGRAESPGDTTAETAPIADTEIQERPGRWPEKAGPPPGRPEPTLGDWAGDVSEQHQSERGLRGLVGGGSSQVSVSAALRARDASRPTAEDIKRAEDHLTIVRRYWTPH